MLIKTILFGEVEIDEKKILNFKKGLPGLEEYHKFIILRFEDSHPILWLQSVEEENICLSVVDSFLIMPDYAFDISDEDIEELGIAGPEDIQVISVVVIPKQVEKMTINLAAPIVVNVNTGESSQLILSANDFKVKTPVYAEMRKFFERGQGDAGFVEKA